MRDQPVARAERHDGDPERACGGSCRPSSRARRRRPAGARSPAGRPTRAPGRPPRRARRGSRAGAARRLDVTREPGHRRSVSRASASRASRTPPGSRPGVSRTSSRSSAVAGITLFWATWPIGAMTTVGVTWGTPRKRLRRTPRRRRRSSAGQSREELARGGDRVDAGVGHRPVRHPAVDGDTRPEDTLLLEAELVLLRLADDGGGDAPAEGRARRSASRRTSRLPRPRARRPSAARRARPRRGARRPPPPSPPPARPSCPRFPARRAARPRRDRSTANGARRRDRPRSRRRCDPRGRGSCPADGPVEPADDVRAPRGDVLHLDREALAAEPGLDRAGDRALVGLGLAGPEDARDADQLGGEVDDLALGDLASRTRSTGSRDISTGPAAGGGRGGATTLGGRPGSPNRAGGPGTPRR